MFLEASVAHLMTGDLDALIAAAERARALSAGAEPAVELLATAVIGEGADRARARSTQGVALLRACEPYLMEADPLAIVEIVGMAGARVRSGSRTGTGAARLLSRVLGAARDASAVTALIHPLAVQAHLDLRRGRWAAALAGASEAAELAEDTGQLALLPHALARADAGRGGARPRGRLPRARRARARARRGDACASTPRSACSSSGSGRIPEAIEALETGERHMRRRGLSSAVVQLRADLIEAYVRAGGARRPRPLLARLDAEAGAIGSAGRARPRARCRGLLAAGRRDCAARSTPRWRCTTSCRCRSSAPAPSSRSASGCGAPSSAPRRASR